MSGILPQDRPRNAADGHGLAAHLVRWQVRRALRRRFATVWSNDPPALADGRAVVVCANHTNWWDGFVAAFATDLLKRRFWLLQEEQHLQRYSWFRKCGVIGIDLNGPSASLGGLRRAVEILRRDPWAALWIFPQGRMAHPRETIQAKPGATLLGRRSGACLLPLVIRYDWQGGSRPSVWLRWGRALPSDAGAEELERAMNDLATTLDEQLLCGLWPDSRALWPPRRSVNEQWDRAVSWGRIRKNS